ncbi:hypothetical protein PIIN_05023 [Serendipita indica DSM 11827]|uniref:G-patch domain-containing protein n=1 Tax=Serendipita indica (strain DSM 11827) TaxID=1109443 RepID=G4TIC2_SERID|nr:hypothetical protein PIIN_05023 [Serendipita indica DSM 11827]
MSYREWDQHDYRGTVRRREDQDDSWDNKKRRRYDDSDNYDERGYRDTSRQDDGYNQHQSSHSGRSRADDDWRTRPDPMEEDTYDYQPKQYSKGKKMIASEASQHVIFLGLDPDFMESDLVLYLQSLDLKLEGVTIIRDRVTGISTFSVGRCIALTYIQEAQKFVEPNFPFVNLPPPQSHGASAAIAYNDGTGAHLGRRVKIDYSQSAQGSGTRPGARSGNDGTRDIGNSACCVVLLRGLDPMATLEPIAEALKASSGAIGQGAQGMKRIVLVRDRYTAMGIGVAFVEFVDVESASQLLAATMSRELHPEGFRVLDRPVSTSFANPASFQPLAPHSLRDEGCVMGSTSLGGTEGVFAKYWDESTVVLEMAFEVSETAAKKEATNAPEKKKKKKNKEEDALVSVDINEFMTSAIKPEAKLSKTATPSTAFTAVDPDEPESIPDNKPLDKAMTFRKVAPLIASKKVATSITKWNEVSHELRSGPNTSQQPAMAAPTPTTTASSLRTSSGPVKVAPVEKGPVDDADLEFCILESMTCYLCSRQLKSQDQLKRHKNLANETLQQTAREKVAKAKAKASGSTETKPVYRDRASERRIIHGQPDIPLPEPVTNSSSSSGNHGSGHNSGKKGRDIPPPRIPTPPPIEPAKDENNIGNKLLKKMGWSQGTGLGLSGEGRVDPIQTAMYASGAGLGASKGKDITKVAGMDYAGLAKESARDRYEQ